MAKDKLKKKHQAKEERRRREMERLQKAIEKQKAAQPPPQEQETQGTAASDLPAEIEEAELLPDSVGTDDELWDQFQDSDLEGKIAVFLNALDEGKLDEDYAFEMLTAIRDELGRGDPQAHTRYAGLLSQLRQKDPDLYRKDIAYYHEYLISDAVAIGRWDAIPDLLSPFAEKIDLDTFTRIIDQLEYHGQERLLIPVMKQAWPMVSQSEDYIDWAIEEFGGKLMQLILFDYLQNAEAPHPSDPALLEATAPYGRWKEGWLEWIVPHLTSPAPSPWQVSDFGPEVDADKWQKNLDSLLIEFIAERRRAGIPYSRGHMAWIQISNALQQQFASPGKKASKKAGRGEKRGKPAPQRAQGLDSPLVPGYQALDKTLAELFPFLGAKPYPAAATIELLPAYLHFLARLKLIHPSEMDSALEQLRKLCDVAIQALESYGLDPLALGNVQAAWSTQALEMLRDDPALADLRAEPPAPASPTKAIPARRPGAVTTYTFKVTYLRDPNVWRIIEIREDQTLNDLHGAIQDAVDFDDDHLYSFYLSNRAWDEDTEYASPRAGQGRSAARMKIGDLGLRMEQRFLYLFDYGDEHRFEVQLIGSNPDAPKGKYPRILERHGKDPSQYGDWEEDDWDEEGEEE